MGFTYTSTEDDGQTIESPLELEHLEGLARWVRTGEADNLEDERQALDPVLIVSTPSGRPEESISGAPFPAGEPNPEVDVNVPSPSTLTGADAVGVQVKADKPDPNFDAGEGRSPEPLDLLGTPESTIENQGDGSRQVKLDDPAEGANIPTGEVPDEATEIPDGEPTDKWSVAAIKAYADRESIDLGDAKNKGEYLETIENAKA